MICIPPKTEMRKGFLLPLIFFAGAWVHSAQAELIAFYTFDDEGDPFADSSGQGNDISGTVGVEPTWGSDIGFDDTGAYDFSGGTLTVPIDINAGLIPDMTWGAWVRTDNTSPGLRKIMGHDNGGWDRTIGLDSRNGQFRYTSFTGFGRPVVGDLPGPENTEDWTFIAASYDSAAGTVSVYVDLDASTADDELVAVTETARWNSGQGSFAIGGLRPDNTAELWDGAIDNVFVYNEALSTEQITALRNNFQISQSPIIHSFVVNPGFINSGESARLSWEVEGAENIAIQPTSLQNAKAKGSLHIFPAETKTYTLTASNDAGNVQAQVTIGVDAEAVEPSITEFQARNNGTLTDKSGNTPDWIEIHNPNPFTFEIGGYVLEDENQRWVFPTGTRMQRYSYLVVFASGLDEPLPAGDELHTNFKLSSSGENLRLLAPDGKTILSDFSDLPIQERGISYGTDSNNGEKGYMNPPTPGEHNGKVLDGRVKDTKFDVDRGFYDGPFTVNVSCATPGTSISYTIDGSIPTPEHGTKIPPNDEFSFGQAAIEISTTTVLRAIAFKPDSLASNVDTQTYIFPKDVIRQSANPRGFPTSWGEFTGVNGGSPGQPVPADYEMNPAIVNANPEGLREALMKLPTMSIVADPEDLFGRNGILSNPFGNVNGSGVHNQRPFIADRLASMEWIQPDGEREIQINCGVRLVGGWSRHYRASPKKSLRLIFRSQFGPTKLNFPIFGEDEIDEFDKIQLRATFSDGWVDNAHPAQFLRDPFMRETYLAMGQPGSRSNFVHLYLNGLYWGIYNPSERPDGNYAASHFGGSESDYDALKHEGLRGPGQAATDSFEVIDGTSERWKQALAVSGRDIKDSAIYAEFKEYVDVISLADYVLVNSFLANMDWPGKNWYAFGRRDGSDGGFKFSPWDSEYSLHNLNGNRVDISGSNTPARFYSRVRGNPEFRLLFADRVHKHAFNGGPLTVESMVKRYTEMANHIEPAIDAEAARWGDNRHTRQGRRDYRKSNWLSARNAVLNNFLKNRPPIAISQYRAAGLYPAVNAPEFNQHGGFLDDGFDLTLDTSSKGTIFYTLDGNDPRLFTSENDTITTLIEDEAEKSVVFVADAADEPPVNWNAIGFDHSGWLKGTLGAGYEKSGNGRYDPLIDELFDFELLATSSNQETIYMLTDFWVDDPSVFNLLTLKVRYDDGFVAYINGIEVARENIPGSPGELVPWDENALSNHSDNLAEQFTAVDATAGVPHLRAGTNVLAIQALNSGRASSDFLIWPKLEAATVGDGPGPSALSYSGSLNLESSATLKARLLSSSGQWSALTEATFTVAAEAANVNNLVISKIHYHPLEPSEEEIAAGHDQESDFEYIELFNISKKTVSLSGFNFTNGIEFHFDPNIVSEIESGGRAVLVSDIAAFKFRYGDGIKILGEFNAGKLNNDGEALSLNGPDGSEIWNFEYNDSGAWPDSPDGGGTALVLIDPENPKENQALSFPENWRPSSGNEGLPGRDDRVSFAVWLSNQPITDPNADPDGDGLNQLLAFSIGLSKKLDPSTFLPNVYLESLQVGETEEIYPVISIRQRTGIADVKFEIESSTDLLNWSSANGVLILTQDMKNRTMLRTYRDSKPYKDNVNRFFRVRVSSNL